MAKKDESDGDILDLKQSAHLYHYVARVVDVYDGDTITVDVDLGLGLWRRDQTIRLWKINTPEVRGEEKVEGKAARDLLAELILGKVVMLRTILDRRGRDKTGKFGRLLGEVILPQPGKRELNVNQHLINKGHAIPLDESGARIKPQSMAQSAPATSLPSTVACPYCGEMRAVVGRSGQIAPCPNCLDGV